MNLGDGEGVVSILSEFTDLIPFYELNLFTRFVKTRISIFDLYKKVIRRGAR